MNPNQKSSSFENCDMISSSNEGRTLGRGEGLLSLSPAGSIGMELNRDKPRCEIQSTSSILFRRNCSQVTEIGKLKRERSCGPLNQAPWIKDNWQRDDHTDSLSSSSKGLDWSRIKVTFLHPSKSSGLGIDPKVDQKTSRLSRSFRGVFWHDSNSYGGSQNIVEDFNDPEPKNYTG
jgi:hypothetical protein